MAARHARGLIQLLGFPDPSALAQPPHGTICVCRDNPAAVLQPAATSCQTTPCPASALHVCKTVHEAPEAAECMRSTGMAVPHAFACQRVSKAISSNKAASHACRLLLHDSWNSNRHTVSGRMHHLETGAWVLDLPRRAEQHTKQSASQPATCSCKHPRTTTLSQNAQGGGNDRSHTHSTMPCCSAGPQFLTLTPSHNTPEPNALCMSTDHTTTQTETRAPWGETQTQRHHTAPPLLLPPPGTPGATKCTREQLPQEGGPAPLPRTEQAAPSASCCSAAALLQAGGGGQNSSARPCACMCTAARTRGLQPAEHGGSGSAGSPRIHTYHTSWGSPACLSVPGAGEYWVQEWER